MGFTTDISVRSEKLVTTSTYYNQTLPFRGNRQATDGIVTPVERQ
jgi:hypothetical protein